MTFSYTENNDSKVNALFERSKPLLLFLSGQQIKPNDFAPLIQTIPNGEDKLAWCLADISSFCPLDMTNFDRFLLYCGTAVEAAATSILAALLAEPSANPSIPSIPTTKPLP